MTKKFLTRKFLVLILSATAAASPAVSCEESRMLISLPLAAGASGRQERAGTEKFLRTELFFGRHKPDGTEVSEAEFADFLSATITPEFPDGLTVWDGIGQFRDADGNATREKAKVLILIYPTNTRRQSSRRIERIRAAYKNRFGQQSVLRMDDVLPARISF